jgi:hypothetical protein
MGETGTMKRVIRSFLRVEPRRVAPQEGDEAGKEFLCPTK